MDSQQIELIGRNRLVSELLEAKLEVARPERDHGIDLIVYAEKPKFVAVPIQMKAASKKSFSLSKKYAEFPNLILAYIWNLEKGQTPATYALTYVEALAVVEEMGWDQTPSWQEKGGYGTTKPGKRILKLLQPYLMSPDKWREKVTGTLCRQDGLLQKTT